MMLLAKERPRGPLSTLIVQFPLRCSAIHVCSRVARRHEAGRRGTSSNVECG